MPDDLRPALEDAIANPWEGSPDWIQIMGRDGDAYFLRRLGLASVLREVHGLDWRAYLSEAAAPHLVIRWPRGHLRIRLQTKMDGAAPYPIVGTRLRSGGERRYQTRHNYLSQPLPEAEASA